jgi:hypothetical protein
MLDKLTTNFFRKFSFMRRCRRKFFFLISRVAFVNICSFFSFYASTVLRDSQLFFIVSLSYGYLCRDKVKELTSAFTERNFLACSYLFLRREAAQTAVSLPPGEGSNPLFFQRKKNRTDDQLVLSSNLLIRVQNVLLFRSDGESLRICLELIHAILFLLSK